LWTVAEAAAATGGRGLGDWSVSGISIDSRTVEPGDLFVAIAGDKFDGHRFVGEAMAKGARAAMVSGKASVGEEHAALLKVEDTLAGLDALARAARARAEARIIAVTGSSGKTGVKDALAAVLSPEGPTAASRTSLNNRIGVPLSLARMPRESHFGVFELGMNHAGELTPLSALVRPHVALITNVGQAHMEFFSSVREIARAKAEIFSGLEAGGAAVLNRDGTHYELLEKAALEAGATIRGFGRAPEADARLVDFTPRAEGSRIEAVIAGRPLKYELRLPGRHWVFNSLAVLAAVREVGADPVRAARELSRVMPGAGRGERHQISLAGLCFELIDDSYNANPASMTAALAVLGSVQPGPQGRRIAVLGDMLELGDGAGDAHAALLGPIVANGIDLVFAAGPFMEHLFDLLGSDRRGGWAPAADQMAPMVAAAIHSGDVVLVKGSAGSRMSRIVRALRAMEMPQPRAANGY
jgi:UDP-N-acetylmuramoyl-tripeptide--D-alanyl-D-alanine ligase